MTRQDTLFPDDALPPPIPPELLRDLRRMNPWWEGDPMPPQPATRRHLVSWIRRRLDAEIAPIVVVRGPRQVGKTTAQFQIIADVLDEGVPGRNVLRVQFDELASLRGIEAPILAIADWFERNVSTARFNELARAGRKACLFFDEVQNLDAWDAQLKSLVDNSAVQVVVTGSSALRIELGRDSLAGRVSTVEAGVLSLTEIGALRDLPAPPPFLPDNGLSFPHREGLLAATARARANERYRSGTRRSATSRSAGGYPIVHKQADTDWAVLADQLNETVIRRVIQHDLRHGARGRRRDPVLLEELFRLACRYAGQTPTASTLAEEARLSLAANVGGQRVVQYLKFLGDTLLLRLIPPLEIRLKRKTRECQALPGGSRPAGKLASGAGSPDPGGAGGTPRAHQPGRPPRRECLRLGRFHDTRPGHRARP